MLSLWGPLGDTPSIRNKIFLGPYKAPKGTNTKATSAKGHFCAYPTWSGACIYMCVLCMYIYIYIYIIYIYIYICTHIYTHLSLSLSLSISLSLYIYIYIYSVGTEPLRGSRCVQWRIVRNELGNRRTNLSVLFLCQLTPSHGYSKSNVVAHLNHMKD